jgi:hypothetical protein
VARRAEAVLFRFWLPTVFGASMMVVEIPLVAAAAARSHDGGQALAAVGIGMSILVVVNSPALALAGLVATQWDGRTPEQLRRYTLTVGCLGTILLLALAVPYPLVLFEEVMMPVASIFDEVTGT